MSDDLLEGEYVPSTVPWVREHVELYESTGGREGNDFRGGQVVVLTTRGARSGKLRKVPLMRIERDGVYALGANGLEAAHHPKWYYNVIADPLVQLQDGSTRRLMTARIAGQAEKAGWVNYIDELYPFAAEERGHRADAGRDVPLVLLEPAPSA